jgi:hypothetical protein
MWYTRGARGSMTNVVLALRDHLRPPTLRNAKSTGDSPPATPASNFGTYTQCLRRDDLLVLDASGFGR